MYFSTCFNFPSAAGGFSHKWCNQFPFMGVSVKVKFKLRPILTNVLAYSSHSNKLKILILMLISRNMTNIYVKFITQVPEVFFCSSG